MAEQMHTGPVFVVASVAAAGMSSAVEEAAGSPHMVVGRHTARHRTLSATTDNQSSLASRSQSFRGMCTNFTC